jgi:hypothetical protein
VIDVGYEGVKTTTAVYGTNPGGGEGGQFDKTPVLSTKVELGENACLNAHLSAIVGSKQTYVWWAGAPPNAPGGAIGAAFVLKLYTR